MTVRAFSRGVVIVAVLAAYAWFGSGGTFAFRRVSWERTGDSGFTERYYAALAQGFLHGRLDLPYERDARWDGLANAYDFKERQRAGMEWAMWDASLYKGRFYLYFSPVPVLLFYIPFRLVAGAYPPDALVATFFSAWAFLACVAFATRLLGERMRVQWILLIGLGNVVPFTLTFVRAYEVAVATGMAMTATFAYALLRFTETRATKHAVWMTVWLALAIATRPNLAVLAAIAVLVLFRHRRAALFAMIPLAVVGVAYAIYNFARFGNPFELGMTYQISYVPMWRAAPCSLCGLPDAIRLVNNAMHYVFWPPVFASAFPYVDIQRSVLDPAVSFAGGAEQIVGIAALNPLVLIGTAIALVWRADWNPAPRTVMAAAWLILLGLATCRWVTARYALDFMLLMTTAAVVCIEQVLTNVRATGVRTRTVAIVIAILACYSVATGFLAGVRGPESVFLKKLDAARQERSSPS
ncbi:MAG TPA: hypothetical protein VFP80_05115 [Thermoanaerobaculia bacterium]|nr:hypothetical protein [Thermoanaerobaculia bacterium]